MSERQEDLISSAGAKICNDLNVPRSEKICPRGFLTHEHIKIITRQAPKYIKLYTLY